MSRGESGNTAPRPAPAAHERDEARAFDNLLQKAERREVEQAQLVRELMLEQCTV